MNPSTMRLNGLNGLTEQEVHIVNEALAMYALQMDQDAEANKAQPRISEQFLKQGRTAHQLLNKLDGAQIFHRY